MREAEGIEAQHRKGLADRARRHGRIIGRDGRGCERTFRGEILRSGRFPGSSLRGANWPLPNRRSSRPGRIARQSLGKRSQLPVAGHHDPRLPLEHALRVDQALTGKADTPALLRKLRHFDDRGNHIADAHRG